MQPIDEDIALVALLKGIDKKRDSWSTIADQVNREGSAVRVFQHEIDPKNHPLYDSEDLNDFEIEQPTLFSDDSLGTVDARRETLEKAWHWAEQSVERWRDQGLRFISVLNSDYPHRLQQVVDMPPFLFANGQLKQDERGVSVVGSRKATPEAIDFAQETASMLVGQGLTVIAGLAAGVDAAAHTRALDEGGRTVAFIGTGITRYYPASNRHLQERIEREGLVLSQFWPEQSPTKSTFPMRNASMSGYGIATVVVEASEHSGTRIQARQAQHHGRPVVLRREVVESTQWAKRLVDKPGIYVADSVDDVRGIINQLDAPIDALKNMSQTLYDEMINSKAA